MPIAALRLTALVIFLGWIPALVLGYTVSPWAVPVVLAAIAISLVAIAQRSSDWILAAARATEPPPGLERTLERIHQENPGIVLPRVHLYPEPTSNAFLTALAFGGQAHLCVSRGAIYELSEAELRELIVYAAQPETQRDLALRCLGVALCGIALKTVPAHLVESVYGLDSGLATREEAGSGWRSVLQVLYLALVHAALSATTALTFGRTPRWLRVEPEDRPRFFDVFERANRVFPSRVNPALGCLFFHNPLAGNSVLNLESSAVRR